MSSENKNQTVNLYGAFNEELKRMHTLVANCLRHPQDPHAMMHRSYSSGLGGGYPNHAGSAEMFYARIVEMQNVLIAALQSHDPIIQEKVAELALTGTTDTPVKFTDEIPF